MLRLSPLALLLACTHATQPEVPAPAPAPASPAPAEKRLHISIDDLPYMLYAGTPVPRSVEELATLNQAFIDVLAKHHAPASVYFNCTHLRPDDTTPQRWAAAGHVVGNHTDTHLRLPDADLTEWKANVTRCHERLTQATGTPTTAFRFPYLRAGTTPEVHAEALATLAALGERRVPVTVATSDWMHGFAWRRTTDPAAKQAIVDDLEAHLSLTLDYADQYTRQVHGGPANQILLIHLNEASLAALDAALTHWEAQGWAFIPLDQALQDPIYALPETLFPGGPSWLYRVNRPAVEAADNYLFGVEENRVVARFGPYPELGE